MQPLLRCLAISATQLSWKPHSSPRGISSVVAEMAGLRSSSPTKPGKQIPKNRLTRPQPYKYDPKKGKIPNVVVEDTIYQAYKPNKMLVLPSAVITEIKTQLDIKEKNIILIDVDGKNLGQVLTVEAFKIANAIKHHLATNESLNADGSPRKFYLCNEHRLHLLKYLTKVANKEPIKEKEIKISVKAQRNDVLVKLNYFKKLIMVEHNAVLRFQCERIDVSESTVSAMVEFAKSELKDVAVMKGKPVINGIDRVIRFSSLMLADQISRGMAPDSVPTTAGDGGAAVGTEHTPQDSTKTDEPS